MKRHEYKRDRWGKFSKRAYRKKVSVTEDDGKIAVFYASLLLVGFLSMILLGGR